MTAHSERTRGMFWGVLVILIGVLFIIDQQGWINIGELWPLTLIALGIWLIIRSRHRVADDHWQKFDNKEGNFIASRDMVNESNTFGDVKVTLTSSDFKGGQVRTTFGDVKVDLSDIQVTSGEQVLRLSTTFGDIKVSVPKNVPYSIVGSNTAGDMKIFDDKKSGWQQSVTYQSENYDSEQNKVKIIASQVFGDLKVW